MSELRHLILADGDFGPLTSKTANSIIRFQPDRVVAVLDRQHAGKTSQDILGAGGDIPVIATMREGLALGANSVLIGIAPVGGRLPEEWRAWLREALEGGCNIVSGLHTFLGDDPLLAEAARTHGRRIEDLRRPPADLPHGSIRSGSATPLSSTITWSGGVGLARIWSNAAPRPSIELQHTHPSVSSIVSPWRRRTSAASMLIDPTSFTMTATGRSACRRTSLITDVLPAPR